MILDCPHCHARFLVADALIPPAGRTVKCGKCTQQWHVQHPADSLFGDALADAYHADPAPQPAAAPAGRHMSLPALRPLNIPVLPLQIAAPVLAILWLVIALYAYFPSGQYGIFSGLYAMLGASDTRDIVFADVNVEREEADGKIKFWIKGSFANEGATPKTIPYVRVQLKDAEGDVLWERKYDVNYTMKAGEIYPFALTDVETSFAGNATSMVLDMGNSFELVMR